ncbi:MAG: TonB family protein [Pseudomonadota bacterium]
MDFVLKYSLEGKLPQLRALDEPTLTIGRLASNKIVLPNSEAVHGIIEQTEAGGWRISDLGSESGIFVNQKKIDVDTNLNDGDSIKIGTHQLVFEKFRPTVVTPPPPPSVSAQANKSPSQVPTSREIADIDTSPTKFGSKTEIAVKKDEKGPDYLAGDRNRDVPKEETEAEKAQRLFVNRDAKAGGDVLEVVAYWGDTVLEVEHYDLNSTSQVATIGTPPKDHFIAAGPEDLSSYALAKVAKDGYRVYLKSGMKARLRRAGKVDKVEEGKYTLGQRDIAQVKYGPVSYFILFVRPPALELIKRRAVDPLVFFLMTTAALLMLALVPVLLLGKPSNPHDEKDDPWAVVNLPEKPKPIEKVIPPPKPKIEIVEKEKPPEVQQPPKPLPKPPKPAEPKVVEEKPKQMKPVEKPVEEPKKNIAAEIVKPPSPVNKVNPPAEKADSGLAKTNQPANNKAAGQVQPNKAVGASGGPKGGGNPTAGAARKGTDAASAKGVEDVNNKKTSGVNLSSLGLGAGKVLNKTSPGAIMTNFQNSAGGAGGGMGSGAKTLGMGGGVGTGRSLGLGGTDGAANNFGSGTGGLLSGQGGTGGSGGGAFGSGAGRGKINVNVSEGGAPGVDGGLTQQEVSAVIRSHLNEIRHCYEQLLQRSPSSAGKVQVKFVVGESGRVNSASVTNSSISDAQMQGCIVGKIRTWNFPRPRGGQAVNVDYPFVFNPI